jgi:hypothetical protein
MRSAHRMDTEKLKNLPWKTLTPEQSLAFEIYRLSLAAYHGRELTREDWKLLGEAAQAVYRPALTA